MLHARVMQRYCLPSRFQQKPWIGYTYRLVSCKFSKSNGPVRYAPKCTKEPKNPSTERHTKSHQHDMEATNKPVPSGRFQDCHLADSLHLNGGHTKVDRKTCPKSESLLDEDDAMSIRAEKAPHIYKPRGNGARKSKILPKVSNVGLSQNELDSTEEMAETKEKNPFALRDFNVESPQSVKPIPPLPFSHKNCVSREPSFQLPKDVENFLLKVQREKSRSRELLCQSHDANFVAGGLCDNDNDRDDNSNDVRCLYLGQETLDDEAFVSFKDAVSNSTAGQEHAKNQAIRYLAMRPYTASQLRKKLESQNITSELADYALATVQKCGLQSDLVYAETFSRARFNNSSWGPRRIELGLKQRGISNEIIQAAIASVFCQEENASQQYGRLENEMNPSSSKMSRAAMEHLLVQATKKWNCGRNAPNETKIRRMVSWLQYRGFKYDVIRTVLQYVQKEIHIEDE